MMEQLSGADVMFFGMESDSNPMNLATFDVCDPATAPGGKVGYEEVLSLLRDRQDQLSFLRRRIQRVPLDLDYPYWVEDPHFNIENHVFCIRLPQPGTWSQLMQTTASLHNRPFDTARPLWDLYVIEGVNKVADLSRGSFAIYMRMHHAFADAATTMTIREILFDESPIRSSSKKHHGKEMTTNGNADTSGGSVRLLGSALRNAVGRTLGAGGKLARATPSVVRYAMESVRERPSVLGGIKTPKTLLNPDRSTTRRLLDARRFDFSEARAIRALAKGATINDVLLAVIGGALRRYLAGREDLPSEPLTSIVPINLREAKDSKKIGNVVSSMILPIHQEIEDPVTRLKAIRKASSRAKGETAMDATRHVMKFINGLPSPMLTVPLRALTTVADWFQPVFASTAISNAPSFAEPRYVAGAEVKYLMGFGMLLPGLGTVHGCTVYAGHLVICLICSPEVMSETETYMKCLEDSFAEYNDLVTAPRPRKAAAGKPRHSDGKARS